MHISNFFSIRVRSLHIIILTNICIFFTKLHQYVIYNHYNHFNMFINAGYVKFIYIYVAEVHVLCFTFFFSTKVRSTLICFPCWKSTNNVTYHIIPNMQTAISKAYIVGLCIYHCNAFQSDYTNFTLIML